MHVIFQPDNFNAVTTWYT